MGQSESWPEGQPEGRCGAWGRASQAPTGRPWVSVRPVTGSATVSWLDGDRRAARNRRAQGPFRGSAKSPEERTRVLRRCGWSVGRRSAASGFLSRGSCCGNCYQGAPFGAPSPLIFEGRKLKAQLARRREDAGAWLFEIRIRKFALSCPGRDAAFFMPLRRTGTPVTVRKKLGPGSAAHRSARATRCAASGERQGSPFNTAAPASPAAPWPPRSTTQDHPQILETPA